MACAMAAALQAMASGRVRAAQIDLQQSGKFDQANSLSSSPAMEEAKPQRFFGAGGPSALECLTFPRLSQLSCSSAFALVSFFPE
jgi:hypothetical protein